MPPLASELIELEDSLEAVQAHFLERGWTDGLPIVPPTPERVAAMLGGIAAEPDLVLGKIPPLWGEATLEKVAINAVMAGCRPAALPVLVAALEAMIEPPFNLYGVQATTHPVAPLLIVNGPAAARLGMHAGSGLFGPGSSANPTLGRALRLCLWNLGGGRPGAGDMATQGSPAKYSYAIAEREEASPWGPLHASLGFDPDQSVVTVFGGEGPHNVNDHVSQRAANLLGVIADTASTLGSNVGWYLTQSQLLVVLGPEHAATIAADGFSRVDVQRYLYEHARRSLRRLRLGGMWGIQDWPAWMATVDDEARLPIVPGPDDILIMVAGGPGKHSAVVPNCCFSRAVSRPVTRWPNG
ncbi:MAG TPA: hypothetical protein VGW35_17550 [Methylomirabilota bacterium]|jgi:hypothetical protein|nr:hypothetical protein [Methylomirabilota bacterium]